MADILPPSSSLLEYVASSRLLPAVRTALDFALQTTAPRMLRYRVLRALTLRYGRETVHALLFALEWYCFSCSTTTSGTSGVVSSSSFAEGMYGLQRAARPRRYRGRVPAPALLLSSPLMCAALSVVPMYIEARLRAAARREEERQQELEEEELEEEVAEENDRVGQTNRERASSPIFTWRRVVAAWEGVRVAYSLLYLVRATPYPSPAFHVLGARLTPATAHDMERRRNIARLSREQVARGIDSIAAPIGARGAGRVVTSMTAAIADYGQPAILCALLGFQMIHWWYTTGEEVTKAATGSRKYVPPPPPRSTIDDVRAMRHTLGAGDGKSSKSSSGGVREDCIVSASDAKRTNDGGGDLSSVDDIIAHAEESKVSTSVASFPDDPSLCPLCGCPRRNPCALTVSGFCFCYPCALSYVRLHGRCPLTMLECSEAHVRRLHV